MRVQRALHFVAGVGVVVVLGCCLVEGKKVEENVEVGKKQEGNVVKMPSVFNFFRRLIPEKTLETIRAAVTTKPYPKAKSLSVNDAKSRAMKSKKKLVKETKPKVISTPAPVSSIKKVKHDGRNRLRTSAKPIKLTTTNKVAKVTQKKKVIKTTTTVKPVQKVRKQKKGKELSSRQNSKTRFPAFDETEEEKKVPAPEEMQVLTQDQKRNRLRQELVRETEGNCLAKILCGTAEKKPKPKEKNTLVSDTAYLIKEFFNIFDFTIDDVREEIQEIDDVNKKAYEAEVREKQKKKKEEEEEEEEEDEEEDDVDDEEDEIYRRDPTSEVPKKKKYTTRTPANKEGLKVQTSAKPVVEKVLEPVVAQPKTRRPKPVSSLEVTTVVGDIAPVKKSSGMNRLGEFVTPASVNLLTSTFVSTSMSGSATLKPVDMSYEIPLKTGKDDADDDDGDDEEDDNQKYSDDGEDESTYHRVTLEELVGDIKLNPADFDLIRRGRSGRGMRRPKMMIRLSNVTDDKYIQAKLREMKMVQSEEKKLQIARKVARSMRQPRQCRQFNQVAQEVLQTCPLTTEVIRFFNTNLKNGTSIEVKRIPPGSQTQGGGLVFLNNDQTGAQHSYFVDNSPQVANTKIKTDLKNPSLPGSHNTDESQYHVYERRPNPNPENAHLDQQGLDIRKKPPIISTTTTEAPPPPPKKESSKEDSDEEQDDEGSEEDEEDDDERRSEPLEDEFGRRDDEEEEEEDDEENGSVEDDDEEYDDDGDDDDEGSDDDSSQNKDPEPVKQKIVVKIKTDHKRIPGATNQPNAQLVIRAPTTKPTPPAPTLPPGIIRVYGIPQPSFDRDFTQLAPIGQPINLFGDEFLDSPPYKRRRQFGRYGHRTSKKAKTEDDEIEDIEAAENVAYNARIPKHPPLEPYVSDGTDDDDDDVDNKTPYQQKKKHPQHNGGKPLGGVQGADGDDDDDDDDKKVTSSEKKDNDDKDNSAESDPPVKIHSIDEPPFVPSVMYSVDVNPQANHHEYYGGGGSPQYGSQVVQYHNQYQQYQNVPVRRPHSYRPIVRPIKIMPDVSYQLRPGRLYPLYHGRK